MDEVGQRIEERDAEIGAFVDEPDRSDRLGRQTRALAVRWPDAEARPALYGVPVGVKDIVRVDGLATRAGSALPPEEFAGEQATVVSRLLDAGALIAGKTETAEFAVAAPARTRNPRNHAHTPGGSSSGSAAAVAAGMVPLAVGTQTVGSMIRPAAYCGVPGFKPTYGRIPVDGVVPNVPSLDTVGLFAPDVAGIAHAAAVVCDDWHADQTGGRMPVLGVPDGPYMEHAAQEARAAFEEHLLLLGAEGIAVKRVPVMDDFAAIVTSLRIVNRYELARTHTDWFARHAERYRPQTARAIREGQAITTADYQAAQKARKETRDRLRSAMAYAGIDLWVAPAATGPAPYGLDSTGNSIMCLPWSDAGLPSLSVPAGRAANELPLGFQLVGWRGADEALLAWGSHIEHIMTSTVQPRSQKTKDSFQDG